MSSSPELRITFHAPTGILSVSWRHMQVHGKVEDVEAFAAMLVAACRPGAEPNSPRLSPESAGLLFCLDQGRAPDPLRCFLSAIRALMPNPSGFRMAAEHDLAIHRVLVV